MSASESFESSTKPSSTQPVKGILKQPSERFKEQNEQNVGYVRQQGYMNVARKSTRNGPPKIRCPKIRKSPPPPFEKCDNDDLDEKQNNKKRRLLYPETNKTKTSKITKKPPISSNKQISETNSIGLKKSPDLSNNTNNRTEMYTFSNVAKFDRDLPLQYEKDSAIDLNNKTKDVSNNKTANSALYKQKHKGVMASKIEISRGADWIPENTPDGWERVVVPRSLGSYVKTKRIADVYYFHMNNKNRVKFRSRVDIKKYIIKNQLNLDEKVFDFSTSNLTARNLPSDEARLKLKEMIDCKKELENNVLI